VKLAHVQALDQADPLASRRQAFNLPEGVIYLDGNSLGALPVAAQARARQVVDLQWGQGLIQSWNSHDWINLPVQLGEKIARLLGAASGQTLCCDSTSINLFKLLHSALHMQQGRSVVLTQSDNFPADLYIAEGLENNIGVAGCQLQRVAAEAIPQHLTREVAVLLLTHVNFKSGAMHDMEQLTRLAHAQGILVIWDLAHSAGAMPLALDRCEVDFAVGCGYKYLNGGPGAPAFLYAATRHHGALQHPLQGWMGHKAPFDFAASYEPAAGIRQFLCGTPSIIAMSILDAALDVFADVEMDVLRGKSEALMELFLELKDANPVLQELQLASPRASQYRGSHLAFTHPDAYAICQALIARQVICDFRAPDILRLGFAPLYISYRNVWDSSVILGEVMASKVYKAEAYAQRAQVT